MKPRRTPPRQLSFVSYEFSQNKRVTRREKFLGAMKQIVPWARLEAVIEPKYPTAGRLGRQPIGIARMLRMYFLQRWFGLAYRAVEDALYDSQSMREFVGIDLGRESVPDATTLLKFRRLLKDNELTARLFEGINIDLAVAERGLLMRKGTMVDATIIAAPPSTKNKAHERDPEMHQTKKGNEWHFGMKAHIGADTASSLVHSLHATAANDADVAHTHEVLHGHETEVFADAGYTGVEKRAEVTQAQEAGKIRRDVTWYVAAKRGKVNAMPEGPLEDLVKRIEYLTAQVRAGVEHPFHVVKNLFHYKKIRYKGLAKNRAQVFACSAWPTSSLRSRHCWVLKPKG